MNTKNGMLGPPSLSRVRTLLFGALGFVWFGEMVLWGFQVFSQAWTYAWNMIPPENPTVCFKRRQIKLTELQVSGSNLGGRAAVCRLRVPPPRGTAEVVSSPLMGLLVREVLLVREYFWPAPLTVPPGEVSSWKPDLSTVGREPSHLGSGFSHIKVFETLFEK